MEPEIKRKSRNKIKRNLPLILIVLVIALAISTAYFYKRSSALKNPQTASTNETNALIAKVSKIALLPTGETPTVATVSDPEKLKDQAFFVDAKVGYKVLVYANAKKAFLYDPATNKIINIAPVNTGSTPTITPVTTPAKN